MGIMRESCYWKRPHWEIMWLTKEMIYHSKGWQDQGPFYKRLMSTKFRFCKKYRSGHSCAYAMRVELLSCHYMCKIRDTSAGLLFTLRPQHSSLSTGSWQTPLGPGFHARYFAQILICMIKCCIWDNNNGIVTCTKFGCDLMSTNWILVQ